MGTIENEPEIVKILRREEQIGKLHSQSQSYYDASQISEEPSEDIPDETISFAEDSKKEEVETKQTFRSTAEGLKGMQVSSFQIINDIVLYLDRSEKVIKVNEAGLAFSGRTEKEVLGKPFWEISELFGNLDRHHLREMFKNALNGKEDQTLFGKVRSKSGDTQFMHFSIYPIELGNKVHHLLFVGKDVTEQKMLSKKLQENKQKFDAMVEYFETLSETTVALGKKDLFSDVNDIIFQLTPSGKITYINSAVEKIAGYGSSDVIGCNFSKLIPKKDWKKLRKELSPKELSPKIRRKNLMDREIENFETNVVRKDGSLISVEINGKFIRPGVEILGKDVGLRIQGSIRDITERKRAAKALRESEEKFRTIFENANDEIVYLDKYGNIIDVNERIEDIFGYRREEVIGKKFSEIDFFSSEESSKITEFFEDAIRKDESHLIELEGRQKNGNIVFIETSTRLIEKDGEKEGILVIVRNITKRKKAEEELRKSKQRIEEQNVQLKKLDKLKSSFLNVTSHELRTPITSIKGYVQMLLKQSLGDISDEQKNALNVILRNSNRLNNLIRDILDVSRLESGTMKFIPEKTDVGKMIDETVEAMQLSANVKNIEIKSEVEERVPELVIDQERIKQVIMNLVNNAMKFSPSNSNININVRREKDDVLFELRDFGRGIPKDQQDKIFDTFYQVDTGIDRKFGGVGLGLAISRGIVMAHGGRIWVESKGESGEGSVFKFILPVKPVKGVEGRFKEADIFRLENKELHYYPKISFLQAKK